MSKAERCPTCRRRITRSSEANRKYWALLHAMSEKLRPQGQTYSADTWHLFFKSRFLGCEDVALPGGKVIPVAHSTASLDTSCFAIYLTQVEEFANSRGIFLEDMESAA